MRSLVILAVLATALTFASPYDLEEAVQAVYWSKIAYCLDDHITSWSCSACPKFPGVTDAKGYHDDALRDSSGYVAYYPSEDKIIYAFRGTIDLPGWIRDFDFFQSPYPNCSDTGCKVHQGLYAGYNSVKVGLWDHLQSLVNAHPNATIVVTGHSMGAAEAGFAYLDVVLNIQNHVGQKVLFDFGSPRLGNPEFVKYMQDTVEPHGTHWRHTNFGDPVVHLPPFLFDDIKKFGQWLHTPREVFSQNPFAPPAPRICAGNITAEDPTCADSTPWFDMLSFRNHTTYLDLGMGCFLENSETPITPKLNQAEKEKLMTLLLKKSEVPNDDVPIQRLKKL